MPQNYTSIFLFMTVVGALIAATLVIAKGLLTLSANREKLMPYDTDSQMKLDHNARGHHNARYYVVAVMFVVFEAETIFLFPWAVRFKALRFLGLVEMLIFVGVLLVSYVWVWKRGALEWI
jgi:NADH-quinone oxidoreductase subunit A